MNTINLQTKSNDLKIEQKTGSIFFLMILYNENHMQNSILIIYYDVNRRKKYI